MGGAERVRQCGVPGLGVGVVAWADDRGGDPGGRRELDGGTVAVGHDEDDPPTECAAALRVHQGAAGCSPAPRRRPRPGPDDRSQRALRVPARPARRVDPADLPGRQAAAGQPVERRFDRRRFDHDGHADAGVEGLPGLCGVQVPERRR